VVWPDGDPVPNDVIIRVTYEMNWICEYFRLSDCLVDSMRVGTAMLGPDNQFSLEIPDFAADPAIQQFSRKGGLSFAAMARSKSHDLRVSGERGTTLPIERVRELVLLTVTKPDQPRPVPATRVVVQFPPGLLTTGAFGLIDMRGPASQSRPAWGYGTFWDSNPDRMSTDVRRTGLDELTIDASHDGQSAKSLKAAFYLPTYGFALIDVANLIPDATRVVGVPERAPINRIRLAGHVVLPSGVTPTGMTITLWYTPFWKCDFFGEQDCGIGGFPIGAMGLTPDAAFSFDAPDLSRDPSLQAFQDKGTFYLSAATNTTDYVFKELSITRGLPVTPSQTSLVLTAVKRQLP
jgi:hypothetical protein